MRLLFTLLPLVFAHNGEHHGTSAPTSSPKCEGELNDGRDVLCVLDSDITSAVNAPVDMGVTPCRTSTRKVR